MILGITGSFGSGKTAVTELFKDFGFHVINVDSLYHDIYQRNIFLKARLLISFGSTNRETIKGIVFSDSKKLQKLNAITHPLIFRQLKKEIEAIQRIEPDANIVVDIPLLFETNSQLMFDKTIVIKVSKKMQQKRILMKSKRYSKKEIEQILASQMPPEEKIKRADFVIDNEGSLQRARSQIRIILRSIKALH